jgi:hypothetical protein
MGSLGYVIGISGPWNLLEKRNTTIYNLQIYENNLMIPEQLK